MPRYDLYCALCGRTEEITRPMSAPNPPCPRCGAARTQVPTPTAFALKGSGWAKDGYTKKGSR
jgi:putative FmdB family regulatory protein